MDCWHIATVVVLVVGLALEALAGFSTSAARLAPILQERRDGPRMPVWDRLWLRNQSAPSIFRKDSPSDVSHSWSPQARVPDLWTARVHAWRGVTRAAVAAVLLARFAIGLPPPWLP